MSMIGAVMGGLVTQALLSKAPPRPPPKTQGGPDNDGDSNRSGVPVPSSTGKLINLSA
jgi:hypothetical protein